MDKLSIQHQMLQHDKTWTTIRNVLNTFTAVTVKASATHTLPHLVYQSLRALYLYVSAVNYASAYNLYTNFMIILITN